MKKNRLLWILMIVLIVPMIAISCEKKHHRGGDDDDDESSDSKKSEKVESDDDSDSKKEKKKLISGEYNLDKESYEAFFGEDIEKAAKDQGGSVDILTSFNFNDDDALDIQMVYNASLYIKDIRNTLKMKMIIGIDGKWYHDQDNKQLTVSIDNLKINDMNFSFAKEDATTKEIRRQLGGEEAMKQQLMEEMNIENEMKKVKGTQVFKVTRLQPDGFTIKPLDSEKRIKFEKVNVNY
ncbi:MAG: hypothetical protein IKW83_07755 [Muribaculaceae bacterium]|nr:hypothetical protein [Muribaculaceae bacterium]